MFKGPESVRDTLQTLKALFLGQLQRDNKYKEHFETVKLFSMSNASIKQLLYFLILLVELFDKKIEKARRLYKRRLQRVSSYGEKYQYLITP